MLPRLVGKEKAKALLPGAFYPNGCVEERGGNLFRVWFSGVRRLDAALNSIGMIWSAAA